MPKSVFKELGFSAAESAVLDKKAALLAKIVKKTSYLSHKKLAAFLNVPESRIDLLMNGKLSKFSLKALTIYAKRVADSRPGDFVIAPGASDTNHPELPHYGDVGNTINPWTGRYDGF